MHHLVAFAREGPRQSPGIIQVTQGTPFWGDPVFGGTHLGLEKTMESDLSPPVERVLPRMMEGTVESK